MRLIGLTGGIATGKSTVAELLSQRGAVVVDADRLAREVVEPGQPAFDEVVARFGGGIVDKAGGIDRPALGAIVFGDPAARRDLEAITHPRIRALMEERLAEAMASGAPLVVADVPLLFERGRDNGFAETLLVYAPRDVQLRRLQARDALDPAAAAQRVDAQMPIEDKRAHATWVIDNSGDADGTRAAVADWWRDIVEGRPAAR
jgi:dephospho-CoA kinase